MKPRFVTDPVKTKTPSPPVLFRSPVTCTLKAGLFVKATGNTTAFCREPLVGMPVTKPYWKSIPPGRNVHPPVNAAPTAL